MGLLDGADRVFWCQEDGTFRGPDGQEYESLSDLEDRGNLGPSDLVVFSVPSEE